jgi:hypothetical protein
MLKINLNYQLGIYSSENMYNKIRPYLEIKFYNLLFQITNKFDKTKLNKFTLSANRVIKN